MQMHFSDLQKKKKMSEEAHIAAGEVWRWRPMQWRVCPVDSLYGKVLWTRPQMLPFNYSAPLIRFFFSFNKCEWLSLRQGCWNKQGHFWRGSDDSLCVDVMSRDSVIGLIMKGISARVVVFSDNSGSNGIQGRCSWETLLKVTIQLYFISPPHGVISDLWRIRVRPFTSQLLKLTFCFPPDGLLNSRIRTIGLETLNLITCSLPGRLMLYQ